MTEIAGKTAFVTGAASGIGLALTKSLMREGANVMMADIEADTLRAAHATLPASNARAEMVRADVVSAKDMRAALEASVAAFGKVHLLFNNAGVGAGGATGSIPMSDWKWITDVNLLGVAQGVETFVPHMLEHGEGGHIVNTASMAGHMAVPGMAPYHATKYAVVGYSESLKPELAYKNIGVSVLCPTFVKTEIHNSARNNPNGPGDASDPAFEAAEDAVLNGVDAWTVADLTLAAVKADRFYIFNDENARAAIDYRRDLIQADYQACLDDLEAIVTSGEPA